MLHAHYATVGVDGMAAPFSGELRNGRLFGRGAYDMKGSLAACLGAVKTLREAGRRLAGDLLVAGVADEEVASLGTQHLLGRYRTDGAIVTEPSGLSVCLAHKGFVWIEIEVIGRAAHGSPHHIGIDASVRMGRILVEVDRLARELVARNPTS